MRLPEKQTDFLPAKLFNKIMKSLPIVSVEALIITHEGLLLLRRNNKPAKGEWWLPGGRIHKGEPMLDALHREVKEETALKLTSCRLIDVYSRVFPERHDITIAYLCNCEGSRVTLNEEHSEYGFFSQLPLDLHPYMREVVKDSGWRSAK